MPESPDAATLEERIEAACEAFYYEWGEELVDPGDAEVCRSDVRRMFAAAGLPSLLDQLEEARQQLETAQAELRETMQLWGIEHQGRLVALAENADLKQAIWDGCHQLGFDTDGDPTPAALVHPPLGQLLAQVIADHMAIDIDADCDYADLEAAIERVKALCLVADTESMEARTRGVGLQAMVATWRLHVALGAAVNDSSTEATQ